MSYSFYFPKKFYKMYDEESCDFERLHVDLLDARVTISMTYDLKNVWGFILKRLVGNTIKLYCGCSEGGDVYCTLKPRYKGVVSRILSSHVVFKYLSEFEEFSELNKLWERGELVYAHDITRQARVSRSFPVTKSKVVFNKNVIDILDGLISYIKLVDRSVLFSWMFCKWVVEYGECFPWLKPSHIKLCEGILWVELDPIVSEALDRAREVLDSVDSYSSVGDFSRSVIELFSEFGEIDLERIPLEAYNVIYKCGRTLTDFKREVYYLWKKGILESIDDGQETFINNKIKMPRRFKMRR